jgi:hypothetical protein
MGDDGLPSGEDVTIVTMAKRGERVRRRLKPESFMASNSISDERIDVNFGAPPALLKA